MIPDSALNAHACELLRKAGRDTGRKSIDCTAGGWGIRYRNLQKRRHIKMTRGNFSWQETVTPTDAKSHITILGIQIPETMLVEDRMVGRKLGDVIDLPEDIAGHLAEVRITERTADTTDYIPIPRIILRYE